MAIDRRTFLKTTLGSILAAGIPTYPFSFANSQPKGAVREFRFFAASSLTIYALALAGHPLKITHLDGAPIIPVETDVLRIGMGERYDAEFLANNPGRWLLAAYDSGLGEGMLRVPLQYRGVERKEAVPPVFHREMRMATYGGLQSLHPLKELPKSIERFYPQTLSGGMPSPFWTINGQVYPNTLNLVVKEGGWVRLRYWNHSMMPHPMHLHGHFFKVVKGKPKEEGPAGRRKPMEFRAVHVHKTFQWEEGNGKS